MAKTKRVTLKDIDSFTKAISEQPKPNQVFLTDPSDKELVKYFEDKGIEVINKIQKSLQVMVDEKESHLECLRERYRIWDEYARFPSNIKKSIIMKNKQKDLKAFNKSMDKAIDRTLRDLEIKADVQVMQDLKRMAALGLFTVQQGDPVVCKKTGVVTQVVKMFWTGEEKMKELETEIARLKMKKA